MSEVDIERFEKEIGYPLPTEYRAFLLKHNGGWPTPPNVFVTSEGDKIAVSFFFYLEEDGDEDKYFEGLRNNYLMFTGRVPEDLLPIASCAGLVCIGLFGDNKGSIFYWDRENEADENEAPWYDNVYWVANSFNEFINTLQDD